MDKYYDEDKAESKYQKEFENCLQLCNFNINEQDSYELIDLFYSYNKGDIYEMTINVANNYTRIRIHHTAMNSMILNISDLDYINALVRAVGKFIEYVTQEYKPTL